MNVTGTSELTTAPTSRFANSTVKNKKKATIENDKNLKPHKRILKFNKKHRTKQYTTSQAFRKCHLNEKKTGLVNFSDVAGIAASWENTEANDVYKPARKVSKMPFKVLDAPSLQDDFYLNLVDWSSTNILAVGLNRAVYIYKACTSSVSRLCEVGHGDQITSV